MTALPARDEQIPYFSATATTGENVDLWSFKQRSNLLILLQGDDPAVFEAAAGDLASRAAEWRWQDTRLILVSGEASSLPDAPGYIIADADGSLRSTLAGGTSKTVLLLVDKFGALYSRWEASGCEAIDVEDAEKTVRLMQSECPECGDKCWLDQI